jgi:DNA-binding Xre family transcriptional regulator
MTIRYLLLAGAESAAWLADDFPAQALRSRDEVRAALKHRRTTVWIADRTSQLSGLAEETDAILRTDHRLLLMEETIGVQRDVLHVIFRIVVAPGNGMQILPMDELREALAAPHRADLFVGGATDLVNELVVLYRGTLEPVVIPFSFFDRRGKAPHPDFTDFEITDYGQAVRFGSYEATTDVILYSFDPDYRRRAKARELRGDPSFGGALRRLRLLKGVAREDFPGISEKQIARIERGEIKKPHARTLALIGERLGVDPSEIESY